MLVFFQVQCNVVPGGKKKRYLKTVSACVVAGMLSACGGGTVIDDAKNAYLPECPGQSLGKIVNGYFINDFDQNTLWTAYRTDVDDIVRVTAEGNILYVGIATKASLEVTYNSARDELTLSGVSFNCEKQPRAFADSLVSNMCDKAKGL